LHLPYKEGHAGLVPECPALHTIITMITSLDDHLKKKKAEIKEKIMTQQPIPIEHKHDDRIDCIIRSMKLARRKLEIDSVTPKNINDQEISDLLYDLEEASTE